MKIDLLQASIDEGKSWLLIDQEEKLAKRREQIRAKYRANWLDKNGRSDEAARLRAKAGIDGPHS